MTMIFWTTSMHLWLAPKQWVPKTNCTVGWCLNTFKSSSFQIQGDDGDDQTNPHICPLQRSIRHTCSDDGSHEAKTKIILATVVCVIFVVTVLFKTRWFSGPHNSKLLVPDHRICWRLLGRQFIRHVRCSASFVRLCDLYHRTDFDWNGEKISRPKHVVWIQKSW